MKKEHGQYTGMLGEELYQELKISKPELGFEVFYDHGKMKRDKAVPHLGEKSGRTTSLSYVDIAIAKGKKMLILCEVEEESADPKKIIGDICNILFANSISVKGYPEFSFKRGFLILGLRTKSQNSQKLVKAEAIKEAIMKKFPGKKGIEIIIRCNTSPENLTKMVKEEILKIVNQA